MNTGLITPSSQGALDSLVIYVPVNGRLVRTYRAGTSNGNYDPGVALYHQTDSFGWFLRDSISSNIMRGDTITLPNDLEIAAFYQAEENNPAIGAVIEKFPHEIVMGTDPDGNISVKEINYRSCDGANWFIIGHHYLWKSTGNTSLLEKHEGNLHEGLEYIISHMDNGIFWEPKEEYNHNGNEPKARVTIWWDSGLYDLMGIHDRENGIPHFPAAYAYQQAHVSRAFRDAADISAIIDLGYSREELLKYATRARKRIFDFFWDDDLGTVVYAIDDGDKFRGVKSDGLSLLSHLQPGEVPEDKLSSMVEVGMQLANPFGFSTSTRHPTIPDNAQEAYHINKNWPKDEWEIDETGHRHNRPELSAVARRWPETIPLVGPVEFSSYDEETRILTGLGMKNHLWPDSLIPYFSNRPPPN